MLNKNWAALNGGNHFLVYHAVLTSSIATMPKTLRHLPPPFDHLNHMVLISVRTLNYVINDSSMGEWMYLAVCPPHGPGSTLDHGGLVQGSFPWLITHTWRGDGRRQVVTNPLKGYESYEAAQQDSDSDTLWRRKLAAVLSRIFICHIFDTIKDTYIQINSFVNFVPNQDISVYPSLICQAIYCIF